MSHSLLALILCLSTSLMTITAHAETPAPAAKRSVMTWVPPYSIDQCRARLHLDIEGHGPKDALTHLALQFWIPTRAGGVEKIARYGAIADTTIAEFRDWAHQHGVRAMLCVYNGAEKWDWPLAQAAFAEHRPEFVDALVAEMKRLDLDGIDVDLEGSGEFESSKEAYVAFIRELSQRLHAMQKQLTVDSFSYQWNAPNQTWWADLSPHVDGLNTMGYAEIGADAAEWRSYSAQKAAAGDQAARLFLGIPGEQSAWQGHTVSEHLAWILRDPSVGVAIWDCTFRAPYWQTPEAWKTLAKIRTGR